ncbi:hypothetical protein BCR36DRAFT_311760 [Piromyces finnis]|uniref:DUF4832 domain-containing protein n=1 Tax=Piromyces finnis TaxID=1754191 RepID=A0A1Y1UTK9_9FUNG|nr:hypothetical protein BCR36DRAFT_311760 [Piromyces finnis]|eukprot:ORX41351.1 hypothetical protein BCR36DRAFT_311760 [Piromyces finnis]
MTKCNKSYDDQYWKYNVLSENYVSKNDKNDGKTTSKKTTTTTKKTTTTTKKTTTTTKKTTTTLKKLLLQLKKLPPQLKKLLLQLKKTTTTTKKTTTRTSTKTTNLSTSTNSKATSTLAITSARTTSTGIFTTTTTTTTKNATTKNTSKTSQTSTPIVMTYVPEEMKETDEEILNPYIGWFHGAITVDLSDRPDLDCNYIHYFSKIKDYANGLQYLGIRLSEYRDREITEEGLKALDNLLNEYKERKETIDPHTQLILRFYYDGAENCKSDENFNPLIPNSNTKISTSSKKKRRDFTTTAIDNFTDNSIENEKKFKQVENGHLYLKLEDFEYMKEKYDFNIGETYYNGNSNDTDNGNGNANGDDDDVDELETQGISFINEENNLQILTFTNENELKKENIELTEEENQKFINKEKYLSEKYLNEYNELSLSENELNDYIENSIFCNDKLNTADIIETNMKIKRSNTDAKNPTPFTKYNATQYNYNQFEFHAAKEIIKKSFTVCEEENYNGNGYACLKKRTINKYCIAKFKPSDTNCIKYQTEEVEPVNNLDLILTHIRQISKIVNKYTNLIYIYQGAFVGTWGEMHHSNYLDLYNLTKIMDTIDYSFDSSIFLSVRKPSQHRGVNNLFKFMKERNYKSSENRIGLYNDGLFYDENDYGTYNNNEPNSDLNYNYGFFKASRSQEVDFQNKLCMKVPNGGEGVINSKVDDENINIPHDSISSILNKPKAYYNFYVSDLHARNIHLSYLDDDYDRKLYSHWNKTDSEYIYDSEWSLNGRDYIGNHLGYRYVIRETSLYYNNIIKIIVENVGYAPAYKLFETNLILKSLSSNQSIEIKTNTDNRKWYLKGQTENLLVNLENYYPKLRDNNYDVYFNMYDPNTNLYIKFANSNKYYKNFGYKIGTFTIEN